MNAGTGRDRSPRSRAAPLVFGFLTVLVALVALIVVVAFTGSGAAGQPRVSLDIQPVSGASGTQAEKPTTASAQEARRVDGNLVADPALLEETVDGPLPKIAADARTPMAAYARPFDVKDKRPRIAVVIGGLGVSASGTALALSALPPDVTLAYVPFAENLQKMIDRARGAGHEVLLQVPMEPFDFPESDPGPHPLLVAASSEENVKRLEWTLMRATGYVGVENLLGGKFLGESNGLKPVLEALGKRGLMFFDNGINSNSVAGTVAGGVATPHAMASLDLDSIQSTEAIDDQLSALESEARMKGFAVGGGSVYPITLDRVAEWAKGLSVRGFVLVPLTAVATGP